MGLQPTGELERALVAGPHHPAFGELVLGRLMFRQARRLLARAPSDGPVTLVIAERDRSIFQGQRAVNLPGCGSWAWPATWSCAPTGTSRD